MMSKNVVRYELLVPDITPKEAYGIEQTTLMCFDLRSFEI